MPNTPLRSIIEEAARQLDVFKHPDITECQDRLSELTVAADLGTLQHECLTRIDVYAGHVRIVTEWSALNCAQTSEYEIPGSVIDADDPIKAAKVWGLRQRRDLAAKRRAEAFNKALACDEELIQLTAAIAEAEAA